MRIVLFAIFFVGLAFQYSEAKLSLGEKNVAKETEKKINQMAAEVTKLCGCTPKFEYDWDSIADSTTQAYRTQIMEATTECVEQFTYAVGDPGNLCKTSKKEICEGVKTIKMVGPSKNENGEKLPNESIYDSSKKLFTLKGCEGNLYMKMALEKGL